MTRILVVDNYDSFVYTIVGYLGQLGAETVVVRNDDVPAPEEWQGIDGVLVSPGPGTPAEAGQTLDVIRHCADARVPMLGVCLGHQALGEAFGATVTHAPELMHGKTSVIEHDGTGVLAGLPVPFTATRYHSLAIVPETLPEVFEVTARTESGVIMGIRHKDHPLESVQFHPESVLTEHGHAMLANWLADCGDLEAPQRAEGLRPLFSAQG